MIKRSRVQDSNQCTLNECAATILVMLNFICLLVLNFTILSKSAEILVSKISTRKIRYALCFNCYFYSSTGNASQPSWSEIDDACGGSTCPTSCPCLLVDDPINCSSAGDATIECCKHLLYNTCTSVMV